jgi:CheY-like chemotaxis protein
MGGLPGSAEALQAAAPTILFVDAVREEREAAVRSLHAHGYVVEEASDGAQAVRQARKRLPDVVVMDVSVPYIDGIEATRRIRALGGAKRPYVIMMSGQADARTRQLAFEAGCDEYIVEPCTRGTLTAAVQAFFLRRGGEE